MDSNYLSTYIKEKITIFQILEYIGVNLLHGHSTQQVLCPFHDDSKPSARIYQDTNKLFCFTCHRLWDPISVVMQKSDLSFEQAVEKIQEHFHITPPTENTLFLVQQNLRRVEVKETSPYFFFYVQDTLISHKSTLGLKIYSRLLVALDVAQFNFQKKLISFEEYKKTLDLILSKTTLLNT